MLCILKKNKIYIIEWTFLVRMMLMNSIKFGLDLNDFDNVNVDDIVGENLEETFSSLIKGFQSFYNSVGSKKLSDLFKGHFFKESSNDYNYYSFYEDLCNKFVRIIKEPKYASLFFEFINNDATMFNIFMDNLKKDYGLLKDDVFNYQSDYLLIKILCTNCDYFSKQLLEFNEISSEFMNDLIYKHAGLNGSDVIFRNLPIDKKYLIAYFDSYSRKLNDIIDDNFVGLLSDRAIAEIKQFFRNPNFQRYVERYQPILIDYIREIINNKDNVNFFDNISTFIVECLEKDKNSNVLDNLDGISFAINFANKYPFIFEELMKRKVIYTDAIKDKIRYMISIPLKIDVDSYDKLSSSSLDDLKKMRYILTSNVSRPSKRNVDEGEKFVIFNFNREIIKINTLGELNNVHAPYSHNEDIRHMYYVELGELENKGNVQTVAYKANVILGDIVIVTENRGMMIYFPPLKFLGKDNIDKLLELFDSLKEKENKVDLVCGITSEDKVQEYYYFNNGENVSVGQLRLFLENILRNVEEKVISK